MPGAMNTAADYLSRIEYDATEKFEFAIRDDIKVQSIEVNIQLTGVADEEILFLDPEDPEAEQKLWKYKLDMREKAKLDSHNDPENEITQLQKYHQPTSGIQRDKYTQFKDNARIRIEQNNDMVLRNLRKIIEKQDYEETEYQSDTRYKHYNQNHKRIQIHQEVLVRSYYDDT